MGALAAYCAAARQVGKVPTPVIHGHREHAKLQLHSSHSLGLVVLAALGPRHLQMMIFMASSQP
jgi:hypothetical protein